jgi:hypothetical protein
VRKTLTVDGVSGTLNRTPLSVVPTAMSSAAAAEKE